VSSVDIPPYTHSSRRTELVIDPGSTLAYSAKGGGRGRPCAEVLEDCRSKGVALVEVSVEGDDLLSWHVEGSPPQTCSLRDSAGLAALVRSQVKPFYLDITGLAVGVWAPLVPRIIESGADFRVVYTEPNTYARSEVPTPGKVFDLSERIEGISPVPSFANLRRVNREEIALVPILGFEGARLDFILTHEDLAPEQVYPVLGAPGFRLEYPTFALLGNKTALLQSELIHQMALAKASCPFELFMAIQKIAESSGAKHLRLAPIGTKPHALGAVLFAIARRSRADIVYDNAIPRDDSSAGSSRVWTYLVSEFVRSSTFIGAVA
jgi:hypothetical protein